MRYALIAQNKENKWEVVSWENAKADAVIKAKSLLEKSKPPAPTEILILAHVSTHRIVVDVHLEEFDHTKET